MYKDNINIALYIGSWPQNIGNAFFDFGAEVIIKKAFPSANVFYTGGAVHWMFNYSNNARRKNNFLSKLNRSVGCKPQNSIEIAQFAEVDMVVIPGMCISKEFVDNNGHTFLELAKKNIPVLFLGAGAYEYNDEEIAYYLKFTEQFYKYAIIARDSSTYQLLKKHGISNIEKGIDCAFFLPESYTPPKLRLPKYNIENFDSDGIKPEIDHNEYMIIRTHHNCWGILPEKYINEKNTLVSDIPYDYLTLYANVNETHSDRVHACIATLAYGNKARLYSKTKRAALFDEMQVGDITRKVTGIDVDLLDAKKNMQIRNARELMQKLLDDSK